MSDEHYPTVEISFMIELITGGKKVINVIEIADSSAYVVSGTRPIGDRMSILRDVGNGCIDYMQATGIAIKLGQMGALLKYFEEVKSWKDGAYFVKQ